MAHDATAQVAAVDLGASSGRVMLAEVGPGRLDVRAVARFGNDPVRLSDGLHWNVVELYRQVIGGLRAAVTEAGGAELAGIGIDTWAVDYGLLRDGQLLGQPFHYRDERTEAGVRRVHEVVDQTALYGRNGLQFLPFNTLYQLAADPLVELADRALLIPDLIGYWLTGNQFAERTNASTTGLLDVTSGEWDAPLASSLGLPGDLLPPLGLLRPEVAAAIGSDRPRVIAVGSHDTASAVVGVPMTSDDAAYISCGTWGLVGVELDRPVVTEAARAANFTNEGGVDGRTRLLTNVMGTWLLSETLREWERAGQTHDLETLLAQAAEVAGPMPVFDVQDPRFVAPGPMTGRIRSLCEQTGLAPPTGQATVVRSIVESLAAGFSAALEQAASLAGRDHQQVHVVGGGAQNRLLCQAIADRVGLPVIAGPVEATALGNVLVQARALGALDGTLEDLRALVDRTQELRRHDPRASGRMRG